MTRHFSYWFFSLMYFQFQFKGATKEIGTALTRICLRHKAMEAKLKSFTSSIMDCLIIPLQKRLEEWNKTTGNLHKEYGKGKNVPLFWSIRYYSFMK